VEQSEYIPGVCNIGKDEVLRRAKKLKLGLLLLLSSSLLLFLLPFNFFLFIFIAVITVYSSILIVQIRQRFCVAYGWFHLYNFKDISQRREKITNADWKRKDAIQVIKIMSYSLLMSFLFLLSLYFLRAQF